MLLFVLLVILTIIIWSVAQYRGEHMLRVIYTFFTGLLLATFIGVGIAAFYPAPTYPECSRDVTFYAPGSVAQVETHEQQLHRDECEALIEAHDQASQTHSRNVSLSALAAALFFMALGLALAEKLMVIADGLLLGGLFTLVYSIGWGFSGQDNKYRFIVVTIGLIVAFVLGYLKFIKPAVAIKRK